MNHSKLKNLCNAAFNASNLGGIGATALSIGMGSPISVPLFASAVLIGTYSKYKALNREQSGIELSKDQNLLQKALNDPSITAKILMVAAGCNFGDAALDVFLQGDEERLANIFRASAWFCGILGDNALRNLDRINFRKLPSGIKKATSKLKNSFKAVTANPVIFYNGAGIAFTAAMLTETPASSPEGMVGIAVATLLTAGIGHALQRTWQAAQGKITYEKINDGFLNYSSTIGNAGLGVFAAMSDHYMVALAMGIYSASAIKSLYETRSALKKENSTCTLHKK